MLTEAREQELDRMRAALKYLVDQTIDNLFDDGREGGSISEGEMPDVTDFIDMVSETAKALNGTEPLTLATVEEWRTDKDWQPLFTILSDLSHYISGYDNNQDLVQVNMRLQEQVQELHAYYEPQSQYVKGETNG